MAPASSGRVGYVLKMYPRFSETFIVNEILAHEAAGLDVEIFSLLPPADGRFHEMLARVRAPVTYLPREGLKAIDFWTACEETSAVAPGVWTALAQARGEEARDVYQALALAREARQRGVSHLHAHFGSVATTVARLAALFTGLSYTFTAHAKDIFHQEVRSDDLCCKLRSAAAVVTVSEYNLAYLRKTFGPAAAGVRRIYNGLDLERFPFISPAERPPVVVAVGRLVEKKGFADLIDACALLARRHPAMRCQIIGTGPLESALRAQIEERRLAAQVELLGARPQGEVIRCVQGAAALAAPCVVGEDGNRDGLPTVLLEAMALGTPCVSTPVTGIPEVVRQGKTGLIVAERDPAALAAALERLVQDSALRVRLALAARRTIEAEFDIHRNAADIRALFPLTTGAVRQVA